MRRGGPLPCGRVKMTPDCKALLSRLCPLHALIDEAGNVISMGPTLAKILGSTEQAPLFDLFVLKRPAGLLDPKALLGTRTDRLLLTPKAFPKLRLKGALYPVQSGAVLNLSFGLSVKDAVDTFHLTQQDFPAADLAVEILYLMEANALAMTAAIDVTRRLQSARQRAESASLTDALTGLLNRRGLDSALADLKQAPRPCALVLMDLDHFKAVNDRLGHGAGDHVLKHVARLLREHTRKSDILARCGGDEFTLVMPDISATDLGGRLDGLISAVAAPITVEGETCCIGASVGWSLIAPEQLDQFDEISEITDKALYQAKENGRSCHVMSRVA